MAARSNVMTIGAVSHRGNISLSAMSCLVSMAGVARSSGAGCGVMLYYL